MAKRRTDEQRLKELQDRIERRKKKDEIRKRIETDKAELRKLRGR